MGGLDSSRGAWIVQNSWGEDWGVTVEGTRAPTDEYSNCAQLAGPTKSGCTDTLTTGQPVSAACQASCGPSNQPKGGFVYLEHGQDACALSTEPVIVSQAVHAS